MNKPIVIMDIDSTLANNEHRVSLIRGPNKDWDAFFKEVYHDSPIHRMIWLNNMLSNNYTICIITGRAEVCRIDTVRWLEKYNVVWDKLYMRATGDYRPDYVVKREIYDTQLKNLDIFLAVDDKIQIAEMWGSLGINYLKVAV